MQDDCVNMLRIYADVYRDTPEGRLMTEEQQAVAFHAIMDASNYVNAWVHGLKAVQTETDDLQWLKDANNMTQCFGVTVLIEERENADQ